MKKVISLILAAALFAMVLGLYGCHSAGQEETEQIAATEAAGATSATTIPAENISTGESTEAVTEPEATEKATSQGNGSSDGGKTESTGNTQKPGSSKPSGNGSGSADKPAATIPPASQPPVANPPATEPPATNPLTPTEHTHSYTVSATVPATCTSEGSNTYTCACGDSYTESIPMTAHNWVHQHQDEVKHQEYKCTCICGARFNSSTEWITHRDSYDNLEALTNHGSYGDAPVWVVDTPARDWDQCSICGATK